MTPDSGVLGRAEAVLALCRASGATLATVESCTGGLVSAALTAVPGSSDVVLCGFVAYSDAAKSALVDVPPGLLGTAGAVSREVAEAMASGGLRRSGADVAVAVTGVAGPGASEGRPAGLVHLAAARRGGGALHERCMFAGARPDVRRASVLKAFELVEGLVRG